MQHFWLCPAIINPHQCSAIESLSSVIRKAAKQCKTFPSDDPGMKVVYLAMQAVAKRWTMPIRNWKPVLNRFTIEIEDCLADYQ